jgi:hypothetical protein
MDDRLPSLWTGRETVRTVHLRSLAAPQPEGGAAMSDKSDTDARDRSAAEESAEPRIRPMLRGSSPMTAEERREHADRTHELNNELTRERYEH